MAEQGTYTGSCHCGAVRYEVTTKLDKLVACNCSMCGRMGWRLAFAAADSFTLLSGEDALTDYQFGRKHLHHPFCKICGIRSFSRGTGPDGTPTVAINVRCLEGVDAEKFEAIHYDGKSK